MPAKIVYGKKRPVARQQESFTKFISPEKDDDVLGEEVQSEKAVVGAAATKKDRQYKRAGPARGKTTKDRKEEDVWDLERGFESLRLETGEQAEEEVTAARKARARSTRPNRKVDAMKKDEIVAETSLEEGIEALRIDCTAPVEAGAKKARSRLAKTPKDHDATSPAKPCTTSTCQHDSVYLSFVSALLSLSDQRQIVPFEQWSAELEPHFMISKIAEASFSEVYRLSAASNADGSKQESVLKLIPLKTPPNAPLPSKSQTRAIRDRKGQAAKEMAAREEKDQWKSHISDVLSEVKLLQNLNHIPGFTVFRDLMVVQGRPTTIFNKAWTSWNKSRPRGKKSEFPDPSKKVSYEDIQLWAVVEMQDAGTDCEKTMEMDGLASIWEVWDVFWGVCLSVAKAEEACRFEHRDLHLGNICIRSSRPGDDATHSRVQDALQRKLHFTSLETTVIDYTLSRADIVLASSRRSSSVSSIPNSTSSSSSSSEPDVAYLDLNKDSALFEGDASEEYQYEIYRYMRGAALYDNPLSCNPTRDTEAHATPRRSPRKTTHLHFEEMDSPRRSPRKHTSSHLATPSKPSARTNDPNIWKAFHPKTNLVWAHFLLHKLLAHMTVLDTVPDSLSAEAITGDMHLDNSSNSSSADIQKIKKKAIKLFKILHKVNERLAPQALGEKDALGSMKELVVLALEERWLRVGDVEG